MKTAVIIIPTYNEAKNILTLVDRIMDISQSVSNWNIHILIVDSNSPDNTQDVVRKLQKKYTDKLHLLMTEKEGLGKAYMNGFSYAVDKLNAYVIFEMDADHSHDPKNIPQFLKKIETGADFVIGSRYIKGGSIPEDWGIERKLFSICANLYVRFGFMKPSITDWTDGYRAIKTWVIKAILPNIKQYSGYVFQIAVIDNALKHKAHFAEIPVNFIDRKEGKSKINSVQYISQTFFYVFTHSSFIKFVIVGFLGFAIDFSFAYIFINVFRLHKPNANAMSAEIAIIFNFFLNNFWSFRHKKVQGGVFGYVKKLFVFNIISSGSILIQWLGITIALKLFGDSSIHIAGKFGISSWILYKVFIIGFIIIPYSYILYNKIIWKEK